MDGCSTHKNEEIFCADVYIQLKKEFQTFNNYNSKTADKLDEIIAQMQSYNLKITTLIQN